MKNYWLEVAKRLQKEAVFFALVVASTDHSPGTSGARLFATKTQCFGTIGGGIMEFDLLKRARYFLESGEAFCCLEKKIHRDIPTHEASGLFCAGEQWIIFGVIASGKIVNEFTKDTSNRLKIENGEWSIVPTLNSQTWSTLKRHGQNWVYEESFLNPKRIAIVGGGHCGLALSKIMHQLGFYVAVFDIRKTLTVDRNDVADDIQVVEHYTDVGEKISFPETTHVVVMTADFISDVNVLNGLKRTHPYIGVMGSRTKIGKIKTKIDDDLFDLLRTPIGLPIRSHTPTEIAVSIAAEIISLRLF